MRIRAIRVTGLFRRFDYELAFKSGERLIMILGPNGSGKTIILRSINALFNRHARLLSKMPFKELAVEFDDGRQIAVERIGGSRTVDKSATVIIHWRHDGEDETYELPDGNRSPDAGFSLDMIEHLVPALTRDSIETWRDRRTSEVFTLSEVLERYSDYLPSAEKLSANKPPDWLTQVCTDNKVRFIDTERLRNPSPRDVASRRQLGRVSREVSPSSRTVQRYSEELASHVGRVLAESGTIGQTLDRTFLGRLVGQQPKGEKNVVELKRDLGEVEKKRARLVAAGLLEEQDAKTWRLVPSVEAVDQIDKSNYGALAIFANDAKQKLGVFDSLLERVEAFIRIANSRLAEKRVVVSKAGFSVVDTSENESLDLELLSSGEQHQLVLLYSLLFDTAGGSLILIDEPELSLHVTWQEALLADVNEIASLSGFQVILATHSPEIIANRWDLAVELKRTQPA